MKTQCWKEAKKPHDSIERIKPYVEYWKLLTNEVISWIGFCHIRYKILSSFCICSGYCFHNVKQIHRLDLIFAVALACKLVKNNHNGIILLKWKNEANAMNCMIIILLLCGMIGNKKYIRMIKESISSVGVWLLQLPFWQSSKNVIQLKLVDWTAIKCSKKMLFNYAL